MKRVLLFLAIAGLTSMVTFGQKKETRTVSGFTGIDASGAFDITVVKGSTEALTIEADEAVMQYVRSEVKKGVLHLYLDNTKKVKNIKTLKATVVMKDLDRATLSGACKLTANDRFTSERFKLDCSGASSIVVHLNTGQLEIDASGASAIQMNANVTGDAKIDVSGASKIQGELKAANVKLNASGVCSAELAGSAASIKIDISGSSKIKGGEFEVKTATIESSGASNITLNVTDLLKVNSSGASTVNCKGSPVIEAKTGGASKIKQI